MTMTEQLEKLFTDELNFLTEHQPADERQYKSLKKRYESLSKKYKKLLNMASKLLEKCNEENRELMRDTAVLRQHNDFLKKQNRKLHEMCAFDALTKVYSRQFIMDYMSKELSNCIRKHQNMVISILDIDDFKAVNDCYGHQTGDEILQAVAQISCRNLRPEDLIGRYGGEEFIIILPDTTAQDGREVIERIRRIVQAEKFSDLSAGHKITASFGIAAFNYERYVSTDELLYKADTALSTAKKTGKNKSVIFEEKTMKSIYERVI